MFASFGVSLEFPGVNSVTRDVLAAIPLSSHLMTAGPFGGRLDWVCLERSSSLGELLSSPCQEPRLGAERLSPRGRPQPIPRPRQARSEVSPWNAGRAGSHQVQAFILESKLAIFTYCGLNLGAKWVFKIYDEVSHAYKKNINCVYVRLGK